MPPPPLTPPAISRRLEMNFPHQVDAPPSDPSACTMFSHFFRTDRRTFQLFGGPLTRDAPNSHATTTDRGPINHLICTLASGQGRSWEKWCGGGVSFWVLPGDLNSGHVVCVPSGAKSRRALSNCLTFRWNHGHGPTNPPPI